MRNEGVCGDKDMSPGDKHMKNFCRPSSEKVPQFYFVLSGKDSEARKWAACIAVERWGNPPDAATSTTQFLFLLVGILLQSIRRVGDHGMNTAGVAVIQPVGTVTMDNLVEVLPLGRCMPKFCGSDDRLLTVPVLLCRLSIDFIFAESLSEHFWCLHGVTVKNLLHVSRKITRQHMERAGVYTQGFRNTVNHHRSRFSLPKFQPRKVTFCYFYPLSQVGKRVPARHAFCADAFPKFASHRGSQRGLPSA